MSIGAAEPRASLQPLEAGPALLVERHDLAVEHKPVERQRRDRAHDLGKAGRAVVAVAGEEPRLAVRRARRGPGSRRAWARTASPSGRTASSAVSASISFDGLRRPPAAAARRARTSSRRMTSPAIAALAQLFHGEPGEHRLAAAARSGSFVAQPSRSLMRSQSFSRLLDLHQGPHAVQLVALSSKRSLPFSRPSSGIADAAPTRPGPTR